MMDGAFCCCKIKRADPKLRFGSANGWFRKRVLHAGGRGGHAIPCPDDCGHGSQATYVSLQEHNRDGG